MESKIIIAVVVVVALAAHIALYRWVKFKIQEGVILQFIRDAGETGAPDHQRVAVVCGKSPQIHADPDVDNSWRAGGVEA